MARKALILDRYEPLGMAGSGGFGTVQIAWDPRIQRKVAIKTIELSELDAYRAAITAGTLPKRSIPSRVEPASGATEGCSGDALVDAQGETTPDDADSPTDATPATPPGEASPPSGEADGPAAASAEGSDSSRHAVEAGSRHIAEAGSTFDSFFNPTVGELDYPEVEPIEPITSLSHLPGLDEARTAAMLSDPRIVTVFDFEVRGRTAYLIMEYVEGITLGRLLDDYDEYLTLDIVACVFDAVAGALSAAHKAGVLHLDIKPDNIMVNAEGQVKVTDFGLATLSDASGKGTTGGGTIGYMPLEQMRREYLDARTDEWSLAAVTYEMLTGDNPFRARDLAGAESAIEQAELVVPSLCWERLDAQMDDVIFYALAPDREERYANVEDFAEEADKFLGDAQRGREQLALVVEDALNEDGENEGDWGDAGMPDPSQLAPRRRGLVGLLGAAGQARRERAARKAQRARSRAASLSSGGAFSDDDPEGFGDADGDDYRTEGRSRHVRRRGAEEGRQTLAERVPARVVGLAARAFSALVCGALACLAVVNMGFIGELPGALAPYAIALAAIAVAVVGAARPPVGTLVSYCLLGIAFVSCGHPFAGGVLAACAGLWFYIVGREGIANANVALLAPLAGAVGGGSVVPFAGGASLRPVEAAVTTAFGCMAACALGALGSGTIIGWDAASNWHFASADIMENMREIVAHPAFWATSAGWVTGAVALSALRLVGRRRAYVAGVLVAAAVVLVGSLVFAMPVPQLFISVIVAVAVLLLVA